MGLRVGATAGAGFVPHAAYLDCRLAVAPAASHDASQGTARTLPLCRSSASADAASATSMRAAGARPRRRAESLASPVILDANQRPVWGGRGEFAVNSPSTFA